MIEKVLVTESGNIHYWISDEIRRECCAIFFLHGLTASHDLFVNQISYFSKDYNVICWDAPAHGASRPYRDFTYEKAAKGAVQILKENGISSAYFVGQSMGGFITQSVIKRFPQYVKGFVSIDSCPFGEKYYSKSDRWWLDQIEWMSALYPDKALRKAVAKQCTKTARSYQNMYQMLTYYEKKELCHLMGIGFAGFLKDNCDLEITCPVMLIVGEKDITGKVKTYNKMWAEDLGIFITWIKNAAHNSNDDQPEQVNKCIEDFIVRDCGGSSICPGESRNPGQRVSPQVEQKGGNEMEKAAKLLYQGHASVRIVTPEGKTIYIDPFAGDGYDVPADLILETHGHFDHTQTKEITTKNDGCRTITWEEALKGGKHQSFDLGFVKVEAVEAGYNRNHNAKNCVGFILTFSNGATVYFSGDTSTTPHMAELAGRQLDYAFICCDGVYNMDVKEAIECAKVIGAKHTIPYHMIPADKTHCFDHRVAESFEVPGRIILKPGDELELEKA